MSTYLRLLLSISALGLGLLILVVSLSVVPSVQGTGEASKRQIYLDEDILPDHLVYPVLMAVDRVKLESASALDRIYIQLEYGNRRIEYAQALVDKEEQALALSTLTKALKYLHQAGQETLEIEPPAPTQRLVLKTLVYQNKTIEDLKSSFSDQDRATLDQLQLENQLMIERLQADLL